MQSTYCCISEIVFSQECVELRIDGARRCKIVDLGNPSNRAMADAALAAYCRELEVTIEKTSDDIVTAIIFSRK